jgi:hypothetical protein
MAKRGRPRKLIAREPNGRAQRPSLAQIKEAERKQRLAETAVVMAQPHRAWARDPGDPRLASALGRLVIRHRLRSELFDAGSEWTGIYRRWRAASAIPDPLHSQSLGGGLGPSDRLVASWWADIVRVENALRQYGQGAYLGVRHVLLDDADLPDEAIADAIVGLRVVAVEMGRLPKGAHPFVDNRIAA